MRSRFLVFLLLFAFASAPGTAGAQDEPAPACSTLNVAQTPSTVFGATEVMIVTGTGFVPRSSVVVTFQQGTRTSVLTRSVPDESGAFSSAPVSVPDGAAQGPASVRALQGTDSATCDITVGAGSSTGVDFRSLYPFIGGALGLLSLVLIAVGLRRLRRNRMRREVDDLAARTISSLDSAPSGGGKSADDDSEGEAGAEAATDSDAWPEIEGEPHAVRSAGDDDDEEKGDRSDDPADDSDGEAEPELVRIEPEQTPAGATLTEPPTLPVGWAAGRVRPRPRRGRQTSDTVARLQREVRTWRPRPSSKS